MKIFAYRYFYAATAFIILMIAAIANGFLGIDGYEHIAVIRELATHPFSPQNPIILSDAPHAFFSPYHVFLGYFSAITTLSAEKTFQFFGIINSIFVLAGLYQFCRHFFKEKTDTIATYALLLILFFWGKSLGFSAFFDWTTWRECSAYPSTFAFGLLFWGAVCVIKWIETKENKYLIFNTLITSILFLTHPTTAISYVLIAFSLSICLTPKIDYFHLIRINASTFLGILLCFIYPYYPFWELIGGQTTDFHQQSKSLYLNLWEIYAPIFVIIPTLFLRLKDKKLDTIFVSIILLFCVYGYGSFSGKFGYGRVISIIAVLIQLNLAQILAQLEEKLNEDKILKHLFPLLILCLLLIYKPQIENITSVFQKQADNQWAKDMGKYVNQYEVILVPTAINLHIAAFGGKTVSSCHPLYFLPDYNKRCEYVDFFYSADTNNIKREALLQEYKVNYVLINKKAEAENQNLFHFVKNKALKEYDLGGEIIFKMK